LDLLGGLAKKSSIFFSGKKTTREEEEKMENGEEVWKSKQKNYGPTNQMVMMTISKQNKKDKKEKLDRSEKKFVQMFKVFSA